MGTVVQFPGVAAPKVRRRKRGQSFYDLYPMPFFNKKTRCSWTCEPIDNYLADCRRAAPMRSNSSGPAMDRMAGTLCSAASSLT
jgi:hypothetical protein